MATSHTRWSESELEAIRAQLARVLQSPVFATARRQGRMLQHIVEATLAGRARDLT